MKKEINAIASKVNAILLFMKNFAQRFEIIYQKYAETFAGTGAKPNMSAFARFLDLPVSTVKSWEKRDVIPAAKDIKLIHDKLGFSYDWLITGEGEMFDEAEKLLAEKDAKIARLEAENRKLNTQLKHDGVTDEKSLANIGKAAGQE